MRPGIRSIGLAALLAAAALVVGCGDDEEETPERVAADFEVEQVDVADLERCDPRPAVFDYVCGSIEVPFERADESYGTTDIGFAYRERDDKSKPSLGPIFAVEGGPGYGSTGTGNAYRRLFGSLLDRHELVLVDMRGTGYSRPVDCPDVQQVNGPEWIILSDCARRLGKHFESYRTSAAADDIDAVREALGFDTIALYGDSYGTFLAQSYGWRHGESLDALVLDSAYPVFGEDPWYPSLIRTGNRSMQEVCDRDPDCNGDALARVERLAERLRKDRISVGPLIDLIATGYSGPPESYLQADEAISQYLAGDPDLYKRLTLYQIRGADKVRRYSYGAELIFGCNDYPMIWDKASSEPERREQLEESIEAYDKDAFGPFTPREVALSATVGYLECLTWPAHTELYEPPADPEVDEPTKAPVLVVSGEHDDITTPWEGRKVAGSFPDSEWYLAKNAGHVDALYHYHGPAAKEIRKFLAENVGGEPEDGI